MATVVTTPDVASVDDNDDKRKSMVSAHVFGTRFSRSLKRPSRW
jgi:hypothetical protein